MGRTSIGSRCRRPGPAGPLTGLAVERLDRPTSQIVGAGVQVAAAASRRATVRIRLWARANQRLIALTFSRPLTRSAEGLSVAGDRVHRLGCRGPVL